MGVAGRDEILARTEEQLRSGMGGVLLAGPEGIGKTHLARALADRVAPDRTLRWVAATPATADVPFGAFAGFLPADGVTFGLPALVLIRTALVGEATEPLLLAVDDAQLLDEGSAALVHQLVASGDAQLLATVRTGEARADAVTRLWKDGLVERVDLEPLDRSGVASLAAELLGQVVDSPSAEQLLARSGGNPLVARELVHAAQREQAWHEGPAGLTWCPDGPVTSARLDDLLAVRMSALDVEHQEALVHLAFGEPLTLDELLHLTTDRTLEALEEAGLIEVADRRGRTEVRFSHPGFGDVLRARAGVLRARRVRSRLVEVFLAAAERTPQDDLRLAAMAQEVGIELSTEVLERAARSALFGRDPQLAIELAGQAFEREPTFEIGRILADARYEEGIFEEVAALWPRWAPLATTEHERTIVTLIKAVTHFYRGGDAPAAFAALDEGLVGLDDEACRGELLGMQATLLMMSGRHAEALDIAEPLLDRGPDRVLVQATLAATQSLRHVGRFTDALAAADRGIAAFEVFGPQVTLISSSVIGMVQTSVHVDTGSVELALERGDATREAALRAGDANSEGLAELIRSEALLLMGRLTDALHAARAAEAAFVRLRHTPFLRWCVKQRGLVAAEARDLEGVDAALADLDALGPHPAQLFEHAEVIVRAWQAHLRGDTAPARAMLLDAAERFEAAGNPNSAARCWYEELRLGGRGIGERLQATVGHFDGQRFPLMAAHAVALDAGDAAAVGAVADRYGALGLLPYAVGAATHAAELHRAAGTGRAATRWTQQATSWAEQCQQVSAPELVLAVAPTPLTRREREVSQLAAAGHSAKEIAERLFLSHRTVENHLARAYDKLGVRSRAELAELLTPA